MVIICILIFKLLLYLSPFLRLAENRFKEFSSFGTDLKEEELDDGVQKYMEGSACFEAFSRTKSSEDLLNLF